MYNEMYNVIKKQEWQAQLRAAMETAARIIKFSTI